MVEQSIIEPPLEQPYEAGRGLITLEGPSGMFLNPTSATLPAQAFTAQYCFFLPFNDSDIVGHGYLVAYGIYDWLEIGSIGNLIDIDGLDENLEALGPVAKVRLLKDEGIDSIIPQATVGYYAFFGDEAIEKQVGFFAIYKRIPLDEQGFVKSLGLHAGVRYSEYDADDYTAGYFGAELQFPYRFYLVSEVTTQDDFTGPDTPYTFGVQWRAGAVNISVAGIQTGSLPDPGFWFGVGSGFQF